MATSASRQRVVDDALALLALDELPQSSVLVFDRDLRFVIARGSALPRYGYQPRQFEGQLAYQAIPPDRWRLYEGPYRAALEGEQSVLEVRSPDGSQVYDVRISPVRDLNGVVVGGVAVATDVSDRVRVEERFRWLAENASDVVFLTDAGGCLLWFSPSVERVLGWNPDDLVGRPWRDLIDAEEPLDGWTTSGPAEVPASGFHGRFRCALGGTRWMEAHAHPVMNEADEIEAVVFGLHDIDGEMSARQELAESEERFEASLRDSATGVAVVSTDGVVGKVNETLTTLLRCDASDLVGAAIEGIVHPDDRGWLRSALVEGARGHTARSPGEMRLIAGDGSHVWGRLIVSLLRGSDSAPDRVLIQVLDATAERRAVDALEYRSFHDELTGLHNRLWILDILDADLRWARRSGANLAVLLIDVDNFKIINDSLGHKAGDELLVVIGQRLHEALRPEDRVARFGGDEFLVVLMDVDGPTHVERVAERLMDTVKAEVEIHRHRLVPTVSMGVALLTPGATAADLVRDADAALFRAKEQGRARWQFFDPALHARALARVMLEEEIRASLTQGRFVVHYQPIVDLADGSISGHEALVRWLHPTRGLLRPASFLETAEASGLIVDIGEKVMTDVCRLIAARPSLPGSVSVNISAVQLADPTWLERLMAPVRSHGVDPSRLVVEVTETAAFSHADSTMGDLRHLRDLGVGLHVDDFGTGYSSIALLRDLPVTGLKLDASFVRELPGDARARALSGVLQGLATGLGLVGIAEGVETSAQADLLREQGWSHGQGYLFGEPAPIVP